MNQFRPKYWFPKLDWKEAGVLWVIGISFLIVVLWLLGHILEDIDDGGFSNLVKKNHVYNVKQEKNESKGEAYCRHIAKIVFGKPFNKIRPDYLRNNVTGHNLELDLFNEELMLGIEVQGKQHYVYTPFFHKNYEHFLTQKYRDELKRMMCKNNNIKLIEIPYDVKLEDMERYLRIKAMELGYNV
jgi:hypothetical protein